MANFEPIVEWLLYQEDDKRVPGKIVNLGDGAGQTRLGITSVNFGNVMPVDYFTTMPFNIAVLAAKSFYQRQHWHHINGDSIHDDQVAAVLLSFSVNKSVPTAVKILQSILGISPADGVLGLHTLDVVNSKDPNATVKLFRAGWEHYYRNLVDAVPNDARFLDGWIARANFSYPSSLVGNKYAS